MRLEERDFYLVEKAEIHSPKTLYEEYAHG